MTWLLMWLNISVATLNATLQLLVIYRYRLETNRNTFSWNVTSLETKIAWELRSKTLKPLTLKGKPRKTHFLALGENLDLVWEMVDAKHRQPKVLRLE